MAIEIKELHIKINVDDEQSAPSKKKEKGADKQAMVQAVMEQVMKKMESLKER